MTSERELCDIDDQISSWPSTARLNLRETNAQLNEAEALRERLTNLSNHGRKLDASDLVVKSDARRRGEESPKGRRQDCASKLSESSAPSLSALTRDVDSRLELLKARANSISRRASSVSERPNRHLTVFSLPAEVWAMILKSLQPDILDEDGTMRWNLIWAKPGNRDGANRRDNPGKDRQLNTHPGLRTIRSLRLVCRQFDTIASPFVCPILNIHVTSASLDTVEQLCSNKLILSGVQCVQIWLNCYSKALADHFGFWARVRQREISTLLPLNPERALVPKHANTVEARARLWWREVDRDERLPDHAFVDLPRLFRRASRVDVFLRTLAQQLPTDAEGSREADSPQQARLRMVVEAGWRGYGRAAEDQRQIISDGSFAKRVGNLLALVSRPLSMGLRMGESFFGWPKARDMMANFDVFTEALCQPHSWAALQGDSSDTVFETARLLYQIPVACHREGVVLSSICIGRLVSAQLLPTMRLDGSDEDDALRCTEAELHGAFQKLKKLRTESRQTTGFALERNVNGPEPWTPKQESLDRLHRAMFSSPCLKDVVGSFSSFNTAMPPDPARTRLYPLKLALPANDEAWAARLKSLHLRGVTVSHDDFIRCVSALDGARTELVHLEDMCVVDAVRNEMWEALRRQLSGAESCKVVFSQIKYVKRRDSQQLPFPSGVLDKLRLYVLGLSEVNPEKGP